MKTRQKKLYTYESIKLLEIPVNLGTEVFTYFFSVAFITAWETFFYAIIESALAQTCLATTFVGCLCKTFISMFVSFFYI